MRVNSIQSGLCEEDLTVVLSGEGLPDALVVPKAGGSQPFCLPQAALLPGCPTPWLPPLLLLLVVRGAACQPPGPPVPACAASAPAFPPAPCLHLHYLPSTAGRHG